VTATGIPEGDGPLYAALETSVGRIVLRLFEQETPKTVANFAGLATGTRGWRHPKTGEKQVGRPLYDGTLIHRVVPNFMIQMGDPLSHPVEGEPARIGSGDPGYRFEDEFPPELRFDRPGLVAMANSDRPNTNGCQFFITEVATPHLNRRHTIFGEVVEGFELVPRIARSPTGGGSLPLAPVVLRTVTLSRGQF
jgi:peptidyl-prolyl cis-trans isomerase A (cyclophilin A)